MSLINPLLQPISPENFVKDLGYDEILLYSSDITDTPDFTSSEVKHIVRVNDYNLMPKWDAGVETDVIAGQPDRPLFETGLVTIDGTLAMDLGATIYHTIEYPIAKFFEHLRNAFAGIRDVGTTVSPRDDLISDHPWFSLGSSYHGTFLRCLVNKFSFNMSGADDPIGLEWGIQATGYLPANAFTYQGLRSVSVDPKFKRTRRIVYGRDLSLETDTNTVVGHFGMPDAGTSPFSTGPNKPAISDYITEFSFDVDNRLQPRHTAHSHELTDHRARFIENMFPHAYTADGQRVISGSLSWWGNSTPLTFVQKITGPGSVQNQESIIINAKCFKIEIFDPVWSFSESAHRLGDMSRTGKFAAASDGVLILPQFDADYS